MERGRKTSGMRSGKGSEDGVERGVRMEWKGE